MFNNIFIRFFEKTGFLTKKGHQFQNFESLNNGSSSQVPILMVKNRF